MLCNLLIASSIIGLTLTFELSHLSPDDDSIWQTYKTDFSKTYADTATELERYAIWRENLAKINAHNEHYLEGRVSYEQGINKFSDQTWDEIDSIYLYSSTPANLPSLKSKSEAAKDAKLSTYPTALDYRDDGWVTTVKDQLECGAGYAFAAIGALEAQYKNQSGTLASLSTQELLDCNSMAEGCDGGFPEKAFIYATEYGISTESDYAYTGVVGTCTASDYTAAFTNVAWQSDLLPTDALVEEYLNDWGPVAVGIHSTPEFVRYRAGVHENLFCDKTHVNHAVLIVGYDTLENGDRYWIIKNSWGTDWGEDGYARWTRESDYACNKPVYVSVPEL